MASPFPGMDPPLFGADKKWADKWLRECGLRPRKKAARQRKRKR